MIRVTLNGKKIAMLETMTWSMRGTHSALLRLIGRAEFKRIMRNVGKDGGEPVISHTYGETNRGGYTRTVCDFTGGYRFEGPWSRRAF